MIKAVIQGNTIDLHNDAGELVGIIYGQPIHISTSTYHGPQIMIVASDRGDRPTGTAWVDTIEKGDQ